jgi:hypothetical protein
MQQYLYLCYIRVDKFIKYLINSKRMTHYLNTLFVDSDDKLKAFLFPLIDNLGRM